MEDIIKLIEIQIRANDKTINRILKVKPNIFGTQIARLQGDNWTLSRCKIKLQKQLDKLNYNYGRKTN